MKYIIAIVHTHKFEDVRDALLGLDIESLSVVEVKRYGSTEEHTEFYRADEYQVGFMPKTKIGFAISTDLADRAVEAIQKAATTGTEGDGRIYVLELAQTVQIKSGKVDADVPVL